MLSKTYAPSVGYLYRSPGGENFADLVDRARSFLAEADATGERIAIIAHGFLNRALAGVLLGLSPDEILRIRQSNDTVIRVVIHEDDKTVDHFVGGDGPVPGLPEEAKTTTESP